MKELREILTEDKWLVNRVGFDSHYHSYLCGAIQRESFPIVKILVEFKANVNIQSLDGQTPLIEAVQRGRRDIVEFLLAQPDILVDLPNLDSTPFQAANYRITTATRKKEILQLLLAAKASTNADCVDFRTPLEVFFCFF